MARFTGSRKSLMFNIIRHGCNINRKLKLISASGLHFLIFCAMEQLLQQIAAYKQEIENTLANGADSLEAYRIKFLGTKGIVKNLFAEMKNVPADQKKNSD